jgi:hypothetical protein
MPDYNIYFEIFGHKKKMTVTAHDETAAKEMLKNKVTTLYLNIIRLEQVKPEDDEMVSRLKNLFNI